MVETGFRESCDVRVKGKGLIESDAQEFDLGSEGNSGARDANRAKSRERFQPLAGSQKESFRFGWAESKPIVGEPRM